MIRKLPMIAFAVVITAAAFAGCRRSNNTATEIPADTQPAQRASKPTPQTFAENLQYVRNGQFTYIWVFSRKDGRPLDKEDGDYLRTNAPQVVDWVTTEDGKKVIGGTNFNLELGNLGLLKKRFVVEDYSGK